MALEYVLYAAAELSTEEFLRYFSPSQGDARTLTRDCAVAGHQFSEGDRVLLSFAMPNRDPKHFPDPDAVKLDRFPNRHAAFGLGNHRCIGSNIARMQFKTIMWEALQRLPGYSIDDEGVDRRRPHHGDGRGTCRLERQHKRRRPGRVQVQGLPRKRRPDEGEFGPFALRDEHPGAVDDHKAAVVLETPRRDARARQRDARRRLERVDPELLQNGDRCRHERSIEPPRRGPLR